MRFSSSRALASGTSLSVGPLRQVLRDLAAGDAAPHQALGGGVAPQPVGAVHGVARHLARGPDVLDLGAAVDVGLDAAHGVVRHRPDGDGLA